MLAQTYIHISNLVMLSAKTLEERLADILKTNGGRDSLPDSVQVYDIHSFNGFSGLNYWVDGALIGQLHIATLANGSYAIYKRIFLESEITEIYDYYDQNGNFMYSSGEMDGQVVFYKSANMDPTSPFVNHLYNVLNNQYEQAKDGSSQTQRIVFIEGLLNQFLNNDEIKLSVQEGAKDQSILNIEKEVLRIEKDPVLKWDERQAIFASLKEVRTSIIETKRRAHGISSMKYTLPLIGSDLQTKVKIFKQRPASNFSGTLYKYTLGNLIWFAQTVKENLGFSIAMAIYGPFTFYFITQPMNPHAMWAVGKVRNAYIQTIDQVESAMNDTNSQSQKIVEIQNAQDQVVDKVSTSQAAIKNQRPALPTSKESWDDRMSNFKAMQIAYEGNMVFAARMGRIEQMEAQFSFPLTAESAWREMERYTKSVKATLKYNTNLDSRFRSFLEREVTRTEQLQVYVWKKMGQYFIDHPYIIVDQSNEQKQRDYYVGKSFIFMQEMTDKLSEKNLNNMPKTHAKVQALAKFYKQAKKQSNGVMNSLKSNSKLFAQKDVFDTMELRSYMQRHWEVLFLQQNKKQEASSFGLQAYTWSIKNALWSLQSVYSAKREELTNTLAYKFNLNNQNTGKIKSDKTIDDMLESMMHMMTLEYVSIKEEYQKNLKNDDEAILREQVINNMKQYLVERDELLNSTLQVANTEARAATTI